MKTVNLSTNQVGQLKIKLNYSTLCTWHYKLVTIEGDEFKGDSEQNEEHEHDLGKIEDVIDTTNDFDSLLTNSTLSKQDYKVVIEWWYYPDNTALEPELIDTETYEGEIESDESKPIMETFVYETQN